MVRHITTLKALGSETAKLLFHQARGIPEANAVDDFMTDKTVVQMFGKMDMSERLCTTAAVRQMSGHLVYIAPEENWQSAIEEFPVELLGAVSYYMDGMFVYGLPAKTWKPEKEVTFPVINCGAPDAHPAHAIADVICMLRASRNDLRGVKACWLGCATGVLHSLVQATKFFPYALNIALPPADPIGATLLQAEAQELKTEVAFFDRPMDAIKDADYVFIGSRRQLDFEMLQKWQITSSLMSFAAPHFRVMLGTYPIDALPLESSTLVGKRSLLQLQAENRLRVYKRMLHWVFDM
jgi:ornithine carbamoyltransferase